MTPERWSRIVEIFERASELDDSERAAFLARTCHDDDERREVDSLLQHGGDDDAPIADALAETARDALAATDDLVGRTLGRFRVEALRGRGGMGVVYRAVDERLGRPVALKVLPEGATDDDQRRRFLREAKLAATINHPNVATVYEVGEDAGRVFIAMEYVDGVTLRERMPVDAREAITIARQILAGLAAAHALGVTHRDLKPDNVMSSQGVVKVLDFGLARRQHAEAGDDTITHDGLVGTPAYMSPEQARGGELDARSDIFSFGIVLYELVAGARPFVGATSVDVLTAILRDEPRPLPASVPPAIANVIARCLAKDPDERYASCADVAADLESGSARPLRRRRRAGRVAGIAMAALVVGGGAWRLSSTDDAPRTDPQASRAYADGLRAFRDGRMKDARGLFARAVEHDPDLAAAHLRAAFAAPNIGNGTASFRKALALRDKLDQRDRGLLDAWEPTFLRRPAELAETQRRMAALVARYPDDAEIALGELMMMSMAGAWTLEQRIEKATRVIELDPGRGQAWEMRARGHALAGDAAEALRDIERCLENVPGATVCLAERVSIEAARGDCAQVERDVRRWLAIEPDANSATGMLAEALAGQDRPVAAVREALRLPDDKEDIDAEHQLAIYSGDFAAAARTGDRLLELAAPSASQVIHASATVDRAWLYEETGELGPAGRLAVEFLDRRDAWSANPRPNSNAIAEDPSAVLLAFARRSGVIAPDRARKDRDERVAYWNERIANEDRPMIWVAHYAAAVDSADDARDALAELARYGTLPSYAFDPRILHDEAIGRTYVLGGRAGEALPYLERAAKACYRLRFPIQTTRAAFYLGEARAATGDTAGACAAYRMVLARWGTSQPRSVTAERARSRARALGCE